MYTYMYMNMHMHLYMYMYTHTHTHRTVVGAGDVVAVGIAQVEAQSHARPVHERAGPYSLSHNAAVLAGNDPSESVPAYSRYTTPRQRLLS